MRTDTIQEIFAIGEVNAIMRGAQDHCQDMMAPLALGLFAGIRTAEMKRHIDMKSGDVAAVNYGHRRIDYNDPLDRAILAGNATMFTVAFPRHYI